MAKMERTSPPNKRKRSPSPGVKAESIGSAHSDGSTTIKTEEDNSSGPSKLRKKRSSIKKDPTKSRRSTRVKESSTTESPSPPPPAARQSKLPFSPAVKIGFARPAGAARPRANGAVVDVEEDLRFACVALLGTDETAYFRLHFFGMDDDEDLIEPIENVPLFRSAVEAFLRQEYGKRGGPGSWSRVWERVLGIDDDETFVQQYVVVGEGTRVTVGPDVPLRDIFSGKRAPTFAFNVNIKKTTPKNPPKEPGPTRPEVLAHPDYRAFVKKLKAIEDAGVAEVTLANEVDDTPSPPIDFEFITEHRLGEGVPDYDPGFFVACECTGGCDDPEECGCLEGHEYRYDDYGRVRNILNLDTPIYECSDLCSCGSDCRNRVVQNGRKIKLQIFKTEKKGWGLRSPEHIPKGTFVDLYLGEVIGNEEAERRSDAAIKQGLSYLFDLDAFIPPAAHEEDELSVGMVKDKARDHLCAIDGRRCGTIMRFINHSCTANLRSIAVLSSRRDTKVYDLALFAERPIKAWEELTFSYSHGTTPPTIDASTTKWPCYCESDGCTGWLFN